MKNKKKYTFFENVYAVVRLIPRGRVTSYGAIANYLGTKKSARMVGWAMSASHADNTIPAHRVVNRNGMLIGRFHFDTPETMQKKLQAEKIKIKQNSVEHFHKIFWDPEKELNP